MLPVDHIFLSAPTNTSGRSPVDVGIILISVSVEMEVLFSALCNVAISTVFVM